MDNRNRELIQECIKVLENRSVYVEPDWAFSTLVKRQNYRVSRVSDTAPRFERTDDLEIYYISDIHLEYHLYNEMCAAESEVSILELLQDYVRKLFSKELIDAIINKRDYFIIFAGDTASSSRIANLFYSTFMGLYYFYHGTPGRVYFVLGNHEYCNCKSIVHLLGKYNEIAKRTGIRLLDGNNYCYDFGKRIAITGATGFAGYNEMEYDKQNGLYMLLSRDKELTQTMLWERQYNSFIHHIKDYGLDYGIVVTHYPIYDWIRSSYPGLRYSIDRKHLARRLDVLCKSNVVYISGHTHLNFQYRNFFCDNQIGYYNSKIQFKRINVSLSGVGVRQG